jgi:thioredoxin reductase
MDTEVLIIGAGPYGISIANELHARNIPFVVSGNPFSLWFNHTQKNMAIRSDWHTSEIYHPEHTYDFKKFLLEFYPQEIESILKARIPSSIFREYLHNILSRLPFEIHRYKVTELIHNGKSFTATFADGSNISSKKVIIATGIEAHKYIPSVLKTFDQQYLIHTWDIEQFENISNKNILVLGNGQSAGEAIALLKANNRLDWASRSRPIFFNEPINLPTPIFNLFLNISPFFFFIPKFLKKILGKKFVEATITPDLQTELTAQEVTHHLISAENLKLSIQNGLLYSEVLSKTFDCIIAATGYKYSIDNLIFIEKTLRNRLELSGSTPKLNFNFETSVKNLYMAGGIAEPVYGPAQRFIMGTSHAAKRLGKVLSK